MNKKSATNLGMIIIASAIIWAAIILACAFELKGTPYKDKIIQYLSFGFIAHLIIIWGSVFAVIKKLKSE